MAKAKKTSISLKELLEAGCHFGHQSRRWNPKMKPYLFDVREGVHIFDLVKTKENLEKAIEFLGKASAEGKTIVFVGTKRQARGLVEQEATRIGVPYVSQRWIGGTITNWPQIKRNIDKLKEMTEKRKQGEYKKYTKKEQLLIDHQIAQLNKFYGGLASLEKAPDILFIVDVKKEAVAVHEAFIKEVTIVALVDSDSDPDKIDYVIPGNDDAVGAIKLVFSQVSRAVEEGKGIWAKKSKETKK